MSNDFIDRTLLFNLKKKGFDVCHIFSVSSSFTSATYYFKIKLYNHFVYISTACYNDCHDYLAEIIYDINNFKNNYENSKKSVLYYQDLVKYLIKDKLCFDCGKKVFCLDNDVEDMVYDLCSEFPSIDDLLIELDNIDLSCLLENDLNKFNDQINKIKINTKE